MSDDTFSRAARVVRETYDGQSDRAAVTRRGLLLREEKERTRRRVVAYVLPLVAVLVFSTAWAAVSGRLPWRPKPFPTAHRSIPAMSSGVPALRVTPAAPAPGLVNPSPSPAATTPPVAPSAPTATARLIASDEGDVPTTPARTSARQRSTAHSLLAPIPSATDAEGELFEGAYRAHFVDHDPARALEGWDAYLKAYPNGRFALEARYNRAIALVRLDRRDEARSALAPFADGTYGSYRQREAGELLEVLTAP